MKPAASPVRSGIVIGLCGALVMSDFFFVLRLVAGVPTPSEMFADASAPFIPVHLFGMLIGLAQGYTPLKIFGFSSVVFGQLAVGAAAGVFLARTDASTRVRAAAALVAVLWLVATALFWPVLLTNYYGLPPLEARFGTIFVLLGGFAVYGAVVVTLLRETAPEVSRSRKRFLIAGTAISGGLLSAGSWAALFSGSVFPYDGTEYQGADVRAITPVPRFYVVTKNTVDPAVDRGLWRLSVGGAVDRPATFDFDTLTARPSLLQETTLMCINNPPEGGLMSNAIWRGIPLRDLIAAAGSAPGALRVAFHGSDNMIETIAFAKAMDPTTLVAWEMNGEPLPPRHGFPVRIVVPGLFGEKNLKWLTGITVEMTALKGFYERQGWGPHDEIPTHARFDRPDFTKALHGPSVELRGVAFCGDRGVSRVEISLDKGATWHDATFTTPYRQLAWRLWRFEWRPVTPGTYDLAVRATDGKGLVQTATEHGSETQGATGLHRVVAHVE